MTTTCPTDSTSDPRRHLGRRGEDLARQYLEERGAEVLDANWRCREGEIDLVVRDGTEIVIVEVKTRRSSRYGRAAWAVTEEKYLRLRRLAAVWAAEHDARASALRIDVIGIEWRGTTARIDHRRGVDL